MVGPAVFFSVGRAASHYTTTTQQKKLKAWNSEATEQQRRGVQCELVSDAPDMRLLYTTPEALLNAPALRDWLKVCWFVFVGFFYWVFLVCLLCSKR